MRGGIQAKLWGAALLSVCAHGADFDPCVARAKEALKIVESPVTERKIQHYMERFTMMKANKIEEVPWEIASPQRRLHSLVSEMLNCNKAFLASPEAIALFGKLNEVGDLQQIIHDLWVTSHINDVTRNFVVCVRPFLEALVSRIRRCSALDEASHLSPKVDTLLEAVCEPNDKHLRQKFLALQARLPHSAHLPKNLLVLEEHLKAILSSALRIPPRVFRTYEWLEPIASPNHSICGSMKYLDRLTPPLQSASCSQEVELPDPRAWGGGGTKRVAPTRRDK